MYLLHSVTVQETTVLSVKLWGQLVLYCTNRGILSSRLGNKQTILAQLTGTR